MKENTATFNLSHERHFFSDLLFRLFVLYPKTKLKPSSDLADLSSSQFRRPNSRFEHLAKSVGKGVERSI